MTAMVTVLLVGALVASSCALVGSFLVLRRMALLGDAISHSVLPGIAIAFLIFGDQASAPMVLGAGALGLLTVFLVELLSRTRRLREDAAIGVVFPALFSVGVILISVYARQVHIDIDCVLFGEIGWVHLDIWNVAGTSLGPKALWVTGSIFAVDLLLVVLLYKELKVSTFDPELAASLGVSPGVLHYVLMAAVSMTVVGSFEAVGAILVVAMLVVPAATAYLLTQDLRRMLLLSVLIGIASSTLGYFWATRYDVSIAGAMASVTGVLFLLALFFSPQQGLCGRFISRHRLRYSLSRHLVLLHLGRGGPGLSEMELGARFGWPQGYLHRVLSPLLSEAIIESSGAGLRLTAKGERRLEELGSQPLAHPECGVAAPQHAQESGAHDDA